MKTETGRAEQTITQLLIIAVEDAAIVTNIVLKMYLSERILKKTGMHREGREGESEVVGGGVKSVFFKFGWCCKN